jgi:hypothetical protein
MDRSPRIQSIIDSLGGGVYHSHLARMAREAVSALKQQRLIAPPTADYFLREWPEQSSLDIPCSTGVETAPFMSMQYCTAIFSFLYHLTGYDPGDHLLDWLSQFPGAEAVLSCGLTESLLSVVDDYTIPVACITFVTRAVRVLDLITNVEFAAFQTANGVHTLLRRLNVCVPSYRRNIF